MKRISTILGIIIVVSVAFIIISGSLSKKTTPSNPYNKKELHPITISQLNDANYANQITLDELNNILSTNSKVIVYFYHPENETCLKMTPTFVKGAKENNINLKLFNLLEFNDGFSIYNIDSVPTMIYYNYGREIKRLEHVQDEVEFSKWLQKIQ